MIECRYCRRFFREDAETVGARCPRCRQPLYERPDPPRPPLLEGIKGCAVHPRQPSVGQCHRCRVAICSLCRTRWQSEVICPACMERVLRQPETARADPRVAQKLALASLFLGLAGWLLFLGAGLPIVFVRNLTKEGAIIAGVGLLLSLIPAAFAFGQGTAAVRRRGPTLRLATAGLVLAASQLGLFLGVLLITVWSN
jgi:hypothetical protein